MTFEQLHEILDNEDKKLSKAGLEQVIYELEQDTYREFCKALETKSEKRSEIRKIGFYDGEQNAFHIALRLLEHLDIKEDRK